MRSIPRFDLSQTLDKLKGTPPGREASMYGPIRDIFIQLLRYPAPDVDIDSPGEGGRPDVAVFVPSGPFDEHGHGTQKTTWIVVEAKDERGAFRAPASRERIFAAKAKYIGPDTAWFVMVEPDLWVIRPVSGDRLTSAADIEVPVDGNAAAFADRIALLGAGGAGVLPQLEQFRDGETAFIGTVKLSNGGSGAVESRLALNRRRFLDEVRGATQYLQEVVAVALAGLTPDIEHYQSLANAFWDEFPRQGESFDSHTLTLTGAVKGAAEVRRHDRKAAKLRQEFSAKPEIARLAIQGLPAFQGRTGASKDTVQSLFAVETANLVLARVLLLRFLEDNGFFGKTRYLCNGGIKAFQAMRDYFRLSYAEVLERAYEDGKRLYAGAFETTELDWIFGAHDEPLSRAIEWVLFRMARYDFTTIRGDILTGIYDRFMDRAKRKSFGEFYTPPSIARFILKRIGLKPDSLVLDPACGSGTFLIEAYHLAMGEDLDRGIAEYKDARAALQRIRGNDLNTFSAVLTQIQLLWQVLGFKPDIDRQGFPDILVTQMNSLVERNIMSAGERFTEIDTQEYDAVVGNPPYVRPERLRQTLDHATMDYFKIKGMSPKLNLYALFLLRALDRWCRPPGPDGTAGKVGFVLPVSLFDSNDTAELRKKFRPGGRWVIREVVDLEAIYRDVFDADVLPAIVIAENRPATPDDVVSVRFADASCVRREHSDTVPEFDLEGLPEALIAYEDLFSPDGRILTRLTDRRLELLKKLRRHQTMLEAAKPFWVRHQGSRTADVTDEPPPSPLEWEQRRLLVGGVAFRNKGKNATSPTGPDVYKAENILATELQGDPVTKRADLTKVDDPGPWRYQHILPATAYAIARVAHCPNAVRFDPTCVAFTNTATLFFPREDLAAVPFDLILMSGIYTWAYAIGARMGILRTFRSDIYPTNFGYLPWTDNLARHAGEIEALRDSVVGSCRRALAGDNALRDGLRALALPTLKERVRRSESAGLTRSDPFDDSSYSVHINPGGTDETEDGTRVILARKSGDWVTCADPGIAHGLALAVEQERGRELTFSNILALPIPVTPDEVDAWNAVLQHHRKETLDAEMRAALGRLDAVVGQALGLDPDDVREIQRDLEEDPFLRHIRPRYPGTVTRKQGFRTGLDSEERYS